MTRASNESVALLAGTTIDKVPPLTGLHSARSARAAHRGVSNRCWRRRACEHAARVLNFRVVGGRLRAFLGTPGPKLKTTIEIAETTTH